jgi:hypothetical protein
MEIRLKVEDWRELHNNRLHNLYFSQSTIRVIKLRMIRWAVHVTCMGEMRKLQNCSRKS